MGKFIDLTGQKFDKLTVIRRAEDKVYPSGSREPQWECECECGNKVILASQILRKKKTHFCDACSPRTPDLAGKRFGRLIAIEKRGFYEPPSGKRQTKWLCQCDCGNTCEVTAIALQSGHTRSCGCMLIDSAAKQGRANKKYNRYERHGDYVIGFTLKGEPFVFDAEDYEKVKNYCWYKDANGYIASTQSVGLVLMHRLVMDAPDGKVVDHRNHKKEDNRKINLRLVTQVENMMNADHSRQNRSGCVGVVRIQTQTPMYEAKITVDGNKIRLGYFKDFNEAVAARKAAEDKYFGEYSYDNSMARAAEIGYVNLPDADQNNYQRNDYKGLERLAALFRELWQKIVA